VIDFYSSMPHYAAHLAPIHAALAETDRGEFYSAYGVGWGERIPRDRYRADRLTVVAAWQDVARLVHHRRLVYVEHGAGQVYVDRADHEAYSGGGARHPERVVGYVCPSETVADRWRRARPGVAAVAVGCPKLDRFAQVLHDASGDVVRDASTVVTSDASPSSTSDTCRLPVGDTSARAGGDRSVAVTFHWPNALCPEAGSALRHYEWALRGLCSSWRAAGWNVVGHGHPRLLGHLGPVWARSGVDVVADADAILADATVLVADNTSLMYEMAALDRPVVALNAPWYRRHVEHGLRFWSHVPGWQVDDADALRAIDLDAYVDDDPSAGLRRAAAGFVYAHLDGNASRRAGEFIVQLERST